MIIFVDFVGDTKVLVAVYGSKSGTKKNEHPKKACTEVIWKPEIGQIGEFCKVEFIQPSNWLYSVPNLLVI